MRSDGFLAAAATAVGGGLTAVACEREVFASELLSRNASGANARAQPASDDAITAPAETGFVVTAQSVHAASRDRVLCVLLQLPSWNAVLTAFVNVENHIQHGRCSLHVASFPASVSISSIHALHLLPSLSD